MSNNKIVNAPYIPVPSPLQMFFVGQGHGLLSEKTLLCFHAVEFFLGKQGYND